MKKRIIILALLGLMVFHPDNIVKADTLKCQVQGDKKILADNLLQEMQNKNARLKNMLKEYPESDEVEKKIQAVSTVLDKYDVPDNLVFADTGVNEQLITSNININQIELLKDYNDVMNISETIDEKAYYESLKFNGYADVSTERKQFVNNALFLEGKIKYVWGGKPVKAGWNENWDKGGGLDCSGFVGWSYLTTFGKRDDRYMSTLAVTHNLKQISHDELVPGDLGTITDDGTCYFDAVGNKFYEPSQAKDSNKKIAEQERKDAINERLQKGIAYVKSKNPDVNIKKLRKHLYERYSKAIKEKQYDITTKYSHVGIYVGLDEDGNEMWVHCTGGRTKTVIVNQGCFKYYYRLDY